MRQLAIFAVLVGLIAAAGHARAERPTEGGLFSFDPTDVVEHWDEPTGRVRVHYSVEGPNLTRLDDSDSDGAPDFAEMVGTTAADVLRFYADELRLRPPVSEADLGLGPLGGSDALDVYLVDFGGNADGAFGVDACETTPNLCAGYLTIENDFLGYGYHSLQVAVDTLTSHELFHGVQNAYDSGQQVWFSEGTATWAERQYDPESQDFMRFADKYLADAGRSLDRPPTGPVPSFAYGTCLWWDFLTTRHGNGFMSTLLLATENLPETETLAAMESLIVAQDDTLADAWLDFVTCNLASGFRSGLVPSYSYASELGGVIAESEGPTIDDSNRFYPLAATYYRLDHAGGPIWFGVEEPAVGLRFALHPVHGGQADGTVDAAVDTWAPQAAGSWPLADNSELPAGGYWLIGTQTGRADSSIKVRICLGTRQTALACGPEIDRPEDPPDDPPPDENGDDGDDGGGCRVSGSAPPANPGLLLLLAVALLLRPRAGRVGG